MSREIRHSLPPLESPRATPKRVSHAPTSPPILPLLRKASVTSE